MNTRIIPALLGALLFSGVAEAAPSIYPVDTARFLGGSRFDFKVEFDGELAEKDAKVLINGQDAKAVLGAKPEFIAKEKGARRFRAAAARRFAQARTVQGDGGEPHRESLRQLGRIRHARQARRQERHPAHRRRPEHGPPHERPPHVQRRDQRHVQRQAVDGHPALHRHARHMQRGFHRRRLRQHRLRLHDRAQVQRERPRRLRGPYPRLAGRSQAGNHRRTAPPHDRQIHRRGFGRRNRGRHPRLPWSGIPARRADQGRNRGYVLQREARRHHRRPVPPTSCLRTSPAPSARTTRTTSKCSRRKAMPSPRPTPSFPRP